MISCPKCGKENQDHYKFCLGCGNELPRDGGGQRPFHPTPPAGVPAAGGAQARGPAPGPAPFGGPSGPAPFGGPPPGPAPAPFGGPPGPAPFGGPPPGPAPAPFGGAPPGPPASAAGPKIAATCGQCGSPNPRANRFCLTCGNDLGAAAAAPPPGPAPVAAFGGAPPGPAPVSAFGPPPGPAPVSAFGPPPGAPAPQPFAAPVHAPAPTSAPMNNAMGVAAQPSRAKLVLIRPDGTEGGQFQLPEGVSIVGRETGQLFATDTYLSPRHATFTVNGSTVSIRDERSLNGVYVRIERQAPTEIRDTDVFRIGQEILRYDAYPPVQPEPDGTERQGAQIEGLVGKISLVVGRDVYGNAFPVPVTGLFMGRERGDILFPEDGYVSGLHCQLSVEGGKLMLTDVGSSNGTYVRLKSERQIRNNDLLLLGQQLFRLTM